MDRNMNLGNPMKHSSGKRSKNGITDITHMTAEEFDKELEKGYSDIENGREIKAADLYEYIRRLYGI